MEILFNPTFSRYEVFSPDAAVRNGERQPEYVSDSYDKCITYRRTVEGKHDNDDN